MSSDTSRRVQRALISVSDKSGLEQFASELHQAGIHILSTGGTAAQLSAAGIPVTDVSEHTQFPEIMGGRVKTLHPKVHGGILGRADIDDDVMQEYGIDAIDLVVVNLYPFAQTIAKPDCSLDLAIENIDIGGPAMLRAAAKNHSRVGVVVDPSDYSQLLADLQANDGCLTHETRFNLARKAFSHTAEYDGMIRIGDAQITRLEAMIDEMQDDLEPLQSFVLPGGGKAGATLHLARTVCRRAERLTVALLAEQGGPDGSDGPARYLNRLSDLLFVQARWIALKTGKTETLWQHGLAPPGSAAKPDKAKS